MKHNLKVLTASLLVVAVVVCCWYKPSIETATITELDSVPGIGEDLAAEIRFYCLGNGGINIDELDCIEGIGPVRLKALKERYR